MKIYGESGPPLPHALPVPNRCAGHAVNQDPSIGVGAQYAQPTAEFLAKTIATKNLEDECSGDRVKRFG